MEFCLSSPLPAETAAQSDFVFWKVGGFEEIYFWKIRQTHKYFTEMPFHFDLFNPPHEFVKLC